MNLNGNCCNTDKLDEVEIIFRNNDDEYILYQCLNCKANWLYIKHENNWVDNIRFNMNEFDSWYLKIAEEDLQHVLNKSLNKILWTGNYVYISTDNCPPPKLHSLNIL